jgi:hypothetical protein
MRFLVLSAALALLAAPALAPALAAGADGTVVRTYETGALNLRLNLVDPFGITDDGSIDHGGVLIPAALFPVGSTLQGIALADQHSPRVRGLACQDLDANAVCGDSLADEARIEFCDTLDPANVMSDAGHPFVGGAPIVVFVFATPVRMSIASPFTNGPAPCPDGGMGFATLGTITLTIAP